MHDLLSLAQIYMYVCMLLLRLLAYFILDMLFFRGLFSLLFFSPIISSLFYLFDVWCFTMFILLLKEFPYKDDTVVYFLWHFSPLHTNFSQRHKSSELALSFLFCSCVYFSLMTPSIVFHSINSPNNCPFSHSVLPVLSLPYWSFQLLCLFMKVSFSSDVIPSCWLGSKHLLTN